MLIPWLWLVSTFGVLVSAAFDPEAGRADLARRALLAALLGAALAAPGAALAYGLLAASLVVHAVGARSRTGAVWLGVSAVAAAMAVAGFSLDVPTLAFAASLGSLAIRSGVIPLHLGAAALAERHPTLLTELAGSAAVAAFLHLRFGIPVAPDLAHDAATVLVLWGASAALTGALLGLAQKSLRGLWSASFTMHGGMLLTALAAAGRGHLVGAVFVAVTLAIALTCFGAIVIALEARVGPVQFNAPGGRARAFPALATAFAFFAAAGIALPGTAGFIADDLLLHALWEESPLATALVLLASATLAIALLRGFSAVFLGPDPRRALAPDLRTSERALVVLGVATLIGIGVVPMALITPTLAFFP